MKKIAFLLSVVFGLNAWSQTQIQVRTNSQNYDLKDAYSITFEDEGRIQVIKTESQGEIRISTVELKQIHFHDTIIDLADQIQNLENCEIMKAVLFNEIPGLDSEIFWAYLNSPNVNQVLIPNDSAFEKIPVIFPRLYNPYTFLSLSIDKSQSFPLKGSINIYDPESGVIRPALGVGTTIQDSEIISILKRLVLNQFSNKGLSNQSYTVCGSSIYAEENNFFGTYQLEAKRQGWKIKSTINVVQELQAPSGKKWVVTDALVNENTLNTYDALKEIAPRFLYEFMYVPMQFLRDCGYINQDEPDSHISFFEDLSQNLSQERYRFRWESSHVNFTIFAPTDEAIEEAINNQELYTWDMIREEMSAENDESKNIIYEKIDNLFAFIKRHICFGNILVDIQDTYERNLATCNLTSYGTVETLPVTKVKDAEFQISNGQTIPASLRFVREAWSEGRNFIFSSEMASGIVININKAIVEN